jgi:hypothetical protein
VPFPLTIHYRMWDAPQPQPLTFWLHNFSYFFFLLLFKRSINFLYSIHQL